MTIILSVIGAVLVLEGIPYFLSPSKVKKWSMMIQEVDDKVLRIMGLISMILGLILLYLIRYF